MRNGIVGSLAALLASGGIALGQGYYPGYPPAGYYPAPPAPGWQVQQQMAQQMQMQQQMQYQQHMQYQQQLQMRAAAMQPMPGPALPNYYPVQGQQMTPAQYYPSNVPLYAQPYYPVVRSWGTVD